MWELLLLLIYNVLSNVTNVAQNVPPPPADFAQLVLNAIATAYNYVVSFIQQALQATLLKQNPQLATTYANIIAWLIPLTALYIILTIAEVARRLIGFVIAGGWIFLIILMVLAR